MPKQKQADWDKPLEIRYQVAFDGNAWRKVHPPHLAAAVAAGEAAIRAHLEAVAPTPYSVASISSDAYYMTVHWRLDGGENDEE